MDRVKDLDMCRLTTTFAFKEVYGNSMRGRGKRGLSITDMAKILTHNEQLEQHRWKDVVEDADFQDRKILHYEAINRPTLWPTTLRIIGVMWWECNQGQDLRIGLDLTIGTPNPPMDRVKELVDDYLAYSKHIRFQTMAYYTEHWEVRIHPHPSKHFMEGRTWIE